MKTLSTHDRFDVLGSKISITDSGAAIATVLDRAKSSKGGYVCFSNVHTVVTSIKDTKLRNITNNSFMSMPDGKPLSIVGRLRDKNSVQQVAGPDFMPALIKRSRGARHYFYGSTQETLSLLQNNITSEYPECIIAGMYSPPFRELSDDEKKIIIGNIRDARPDYIWVALGAPKQEYWMSENSRMLEPSILLGVGAAFDFHAGVISRSPLWMKNLSIEWLHRIIQEPRRLWKRYAVTNSLFIYYLIVNSIKDKIRE